MNKRSAPRHQPRPVYYTREQLDEQEHAHDVGQTAELPDGINGVTEYYWDRKPTVKIDARLTQQHWRETRRRSTLTHECSHYADFRIMPSCSVLIGSA
jgi:hypothetical protein